MAKLRPFRQIDENDVVNLFAFDGDNVDAGAIVKLELGTYDASATLKYSKAWSGLDEFDTVGINNDYANTVSDRYSVTARVGLANSGDHVLGMLLFGCKEYDENGEKLIWHPRKAHEMQVSLSGQAIPVATRGIVLVNGIVDDGNLHSKAVAPGVKLYAEDGGGIMTHDEVSADKHSHAPWKDSYIGYCLGQDDGNGNVLIKLEPRSWTS